MAPPPPAKDATASGVSVSALWATDADLQERIKRAEHERIHARGWRLLVLAFSTLGVVYGDIGTSPLYVYSAVFPDGAPADERVILGVGSMIFWTITSIVLVKYIIFTMQADDNGEGGVFALYALVCRAAGIQHGAQALHEADLSLSQYTKPGGDDGDEVAPAQPWGAPPRRRKLHQRVARGMRALLSRSGAAQTALLVVVLLASCLIISDGVLTPAISVVSAVEGIQFQVGISNAAVVGISIGILFALFAVQGFGTHRVSGLFSPIMLLWFIANAGIGIYNLTQHGAGAFKALSPHYIYWYWSGRAHEAWQGLGNILLCVTGAEALYADMGHFNARSIRLSFMAAVYPSLLVTYMGQTAVIMAKPEAAAHAYWEAVPGPLLWPVVVLATAAAIIASQALITGSFSIVQQAMSMNAFPRLTIRHTSSHHIGQVYIPEVNWLLLVGAIAVVAIFQTSTKIGNAYGLAVVCVMLLDTALLALVQLAAWEWRLWAVGTLWLVFTFITGAFFSSNILKVPRGAWFTLALAAILSAICFVWHWGQSAKLRLVRQGRVMLRDLFELDPRPPLAGKLAAIAGGGGGGGLARASATSASTGTASESVSGIGAAYPQALRLAASQRPLARVAGVGIYLNELLVGVPPVLERWLHRMPAIHAVAVFLTVRVVPVPAVLPSERLLIRRLRFQGFYHVVARYGYMEGVDAGPQLVELVLQEIHAYLHPMTGVDDLVGADGSVHRAVAEWSHHGGAAYHSGAPADTPTAGGAGAGGGGAGGDVEMGLALARTSVGGGGLRRLSMARPTVVHVDPADSLTVATGRRMGHHLSVQLVRLSTSTVGGADDTIHSRTSSGARRRLPAAPPAPPGAHLARRSAITMAVPLSAEEAEWEAGPAAATAGVKASEWRPAAAEPAPAPWVQMPSVLRRVRAQMLGQPEAAAADWPRLPPAGSRPTSPAVTPRPRGDSAAAELGADPEALSLPLPARRRPPLPRLAAAADATASLPLPAAGPRPALQSVRQRATASPDQERQPLMEAGAAAPTADSSRSGQGASQAPAAAAAAAATDGSAAAKAAQLGRRSAGGGATGDRTLSKAAAAQLGQQLWHRLQTQRYLGEAAAAAMEPLEEGIQLADVPAGELRQRAAAPPSGGSAPGSVATEVAMQRAAPPDPEAARRQLFDVHAQATASQLQDAYAAERAALVAARADGVAYLVGRSALLAAPGSSWWKRFLVERLYGSLTYLARPTTATYRLPRDGLLQLGIDYEL